MHTIHTVFYYLAMWLGLSDINGSWYAFWSGIGADLGEVALIGTLAHHIRSSRRQRARNHQELIAKLTDESTN
jgi:hypothetical protein